MRQRQVIPGFGLTMGFSLLYLGFILLVPVASLLLYTATMSWADFWAAVSHPQVLSSFAVPPPSCRCRAQGVRYRTFFGTGYTPLGRTHPREWRE